MNDLEANAIRDQLRQAVEVLDPVGPPMSAIQQRAVRRKWTNRLGIGLGGVALAGAGALVATLIVAASPGSKATITPAATPSRQSLVDFATANGAITSRFGQQVAGPIKSPTGFYGAFTVKSGVQVAAWRDSKWTRDGTAVSKLGPGRFVMRLTEGPTLSDMQAPTFYLRTMGGDVSYFGSVLQNRRGRWAPVHFTGCRHHGLCPPGTSEPYARPHGTRMVSVHNTCTPNCADGTHYRVRWWWALRLRPGQPNNHHPQEVFSPARVHNVA
jgi:hypothetical protein